MKILLIDNYDSFTYNIAHIVRACNKVKLEIIKSDHLKLSSVAGYDKVIFSPGPDLPRKGNIMEMVLGSYQSAKSILGICLGLQAIVLYYGGSLIRLDEVVHGRTKLLERTAAPSLLLEHIPGSFTAGFYHSWIADKDKLPSCLDITCRSAENRVMGIRHHNYDIEAVQFHPESIMTPLGVKMMENWINA